MGGLTCLLEEHNLIEVIIAQGLMGIAYSLLSGTHTARIYDTLLSVGCENEYRQLEGKRLAVSLYSIAVASVAVGYLYTVDHRLPGILSVAAQFCAVIIASFIDEPKRNKPAVAKHLIIDIFETTNMHLTAEEK